MAAMAPRTSASGLANLAAASFEFGAAVLVEVEPAEPVVVVLRRVAELKVALRLMVATPVPAEMREEVVIVAEAVVVEMVRFLRADETAEEMAEEREDEADEAEDADEADADEEEAADPPEIVN